MTNEGCIMRNQLIAAALIVTALAASAEELKSYDHRVLPTEDGHYALFCSRPDAEGSPGGDAFVVIVSGPDVNAAEIEGSFGLYVDDGQPAVGMIDPERIGEVRAAPETKTFAVRLDEEQHGIAKALTGEWSQRDNFIDEPDITALNYCETLAGRLKLKKPFRPVLSRANPHVYFADLAALNRDPKPEP
jgi:hypothetical protein